MKKKDEGKKGEWGSIDMGLKHEQLFSLNNQ
jgi:hypothetical protein